MYHGEFVMHGLQFLLVLIGINHIATKIVPISMKVIPHMMRKMIIINPLIITK